DDGWLTAWKGVRELDGRLPVSRLLAEGIDLVENDQGQALAADEMVETRGRVRPALRQGRKILLVCREAGLARRVPGEPESGGDMVRARGSIGRASMRASLAMGLLVLASPSVPAENLAVFEVRVDGKAQTWSLAQVQKLPLANFTNRQGQRRTAVLLSTLLERSGAPLERTAAVTVIGLGGDTTKGPATKTL